MFAFSHPVYTFQNVIDALHGKYGYREIDFRYELLDKQNNRKYDLPNVTKTSIDYSSLSEIKRVAKITMIEDESLDINYLSDRIKPYLRLWIPPTPKKTPEYAFYSHIQVVETSTNEDDVPGGWVEFPLGVFFLSSPNRVDEGNGVIKREIDAYDGLVVLLNDKFTTRYTVTAGTRYYDAVVAILTSAGITTYNLEQTDDVLPRDIEFEPGRQKLFALNELLRQINFTQIHVDENGYYVTHKYRSPSERSEEYRYVTDENSITFEGASEELNLFDVPNVFTVVRTNEEEAPLVSSFINDNPNSPTSTVSRGFQYVDIREIDNIADQAALDAYVQRIAFDASQVYGRIQFSTALMPFHGFSNVLYFQYDALGIAGKFVELKWTMDLSSDGMMTHEIRQIVDVGGVT